MSKRSRVVASRPIRAAVFFVGLFALEFSVLLAVSPRLFWSDDAMTQYSPTMWWLGHHQHGLIPPLMNPELGDAASFATDMQYGVLDPLHWVWQAVAATFSDMAPFSALFGCVCLLIVGSGVLVQLSLRGVSPLLAASVAVGVSSSGFLLWFGSDWWSLLWSAGCICWIWNGLLLRSWRGPLVLGIATAALFTSGYPYFLAFAVVLFVVHQLEVVLAARSWRILIDRRRWLQYAAVCGGLLYSLPTLLTMLQSRTLTDRPGSEVFLGNSGVGVPNFLDVVLGSPTLLGEINYADFALPVTYTFVVTLPLIALIRWDRLLSVPGALTGSVVAGAAVALTQLPAVVAGFRNPIIYLTMVQIVLPVTLVVLLVHARRITRRRVWLAASIVGAQTLLAVTRAPNFFVWAALSFLVLAAALVALLVYLPPRRVSGVRLQRSAAAALALLSLAPGVLSMGALVWLQNVQEDLRIVGLQTAATRQPLRIEPGWGIESTSVSSFVEHSVAPGASASVYDFRDQDIDPAFASGAFAGNQNLFANASLGYGYALAVSQQDRERHECRGHFGAACAPELLLASAPAPAVGERWIDVLSQPVVLVNAGAPGDVVAYLRSHWRSTAAPAGWLRFVKKDRLPGRITALDGVRVDSSGWGTGLGRIGSSMEHYRVSTGASSGSVVFYTTFWPGLEATVDGRSVPVSALDGSVLQVDLPAGLDRARLEISYAPIGSKILALVVVGPVIILLTALSALLMNRRPRRRFVELSVPTETTRADLDLVRQ